MRVGILTFHYAFNHGAALQTYATQELLRGMGHKVEVIDYHNQAVDGFYDSMRFHLAPLLRKRKKRYLLSPILFWLQRRAFKRFKRKNLLISETRYKQVKYAKPPVDLASRYDVILIGSDQVWNLNITNGFDQWYWGNFTTDGIAPKAKIATWSVCMNNTCLADGETDQMSGYLKNFDALSVRENDLQQLVSRLTKTIVAQTLDPTLLLPVEKWKSLCHKVKPKNYVAVYAINFWDKRRLTRVARRLAEREGLSLVLLRVYVETGSLSDALQGCGPEEFLSYMNGARYVVTSSFHGTAYSLLFKKQFFCVIDPEMGNVRVENLLRLSDKKDRIIGYDEEFNQITPIDYSQYDVEKVLAAERERSMDYLKGLFA